MIEHPSHKLPTDKRAALFQISSGEFAANGFKQASLNRIISELGMSKSSFYHYFANKQDLFRQTLEYVLKPVLDLHQSVDIKALTTDTLWPSIMQIVGEATRMVNSSPEMVMAGRMFYRCYDDPGGHELTQEILGEFTTWTTKLIQHGQVLGVFRSDLPDTFLIEILMAMGMSMDRWIVKNWDELDEQGRMDISQAGFSLFVRLLEPDKC
ncbi:MAG: TetR/AcrR family transcriptional regulator [Rhodobacteraceae bacterium]|nr:TetR/AcrR family transcriptional regulator [Paracoccaceae bacterium]